MTFFEFVVDRRDQILTLLFQHVQLTFIAVAVAIAVGVPLGILISRYRNMHKPIMGFANVVQAIPSMAILGFLIPFLGIGTVPAVFMVTLYALLPIIKNTATGLDNINKETLEAAKGIGMTKLQVLFRVQFPLALPVIMAGVRISAVTAVGLMTLASFIGAGGLGYLIYSGVQMVNTNMILAGAIPSCILALLMDFVFAFIEKAVTPISLRLGAALPSSQKELTRLRAMRRNTFRVAAGLLAALLIFVGVSSIQLEPKTVTVTSKYYPEQLIMGNMVSDLIEAHTDIKVNRKLNLGGTQVCFNALTSGEADIQVEYTGSMFVSVLGHDPLYDQEALYQQVKQEYKDLYDLQVMDDWGFNNTYALAVRQDTAEKYNLETISDLAKVADKLVFTPTIEFSNREDGMLGLNKMYNMKFKEVVPVDGGLRYTAINTNNCDVIVAYTTDSLVSGYNLKLLKDDKNFFLPYYAVAVCRQDTLVKYPELNNVLNMLAGQLTDEVMSKLNYQVEVDGKDADVVARAFLEENGYL